MQTKQYTLRPRILFEVHLPPAQVVSCALKRKIERDTPAEISFAIDTRPPLPNVDDAGPSTLTPLHIALSQWKKMHVMDRM